MGKVLTDCGYEMYAPVVSNQLFPILPDEMIEALSEEIGMYVQFPAKEGESVVRLVTSWATKTEDVDTFEQIIRQYGSEER